MIDNVLKFGMGSDAQTNDLRWNSIPSEGHCVQLSFY